MFVQHFIKLSAAVLERKKLSDDAENNTAVAFAGSKNKTKNLRQSPT